MIDMKSLTEKDLESLQKRKAFYVYYDWTEAIDSLSNEGAGQLFKAILHYQTGDEFEITDPGARLAMMLLKGKMDGDTEKYILKCRNRREAVSTRYKKDDTNATNSTNATNVDNSIQMNTNATNVDKCIQNLQMNTKSTDTDTDTETDTDTDTDTETDTELYKHCPHDVESDRTDVESEGSAAGGAVSKQQEEFTDSALRKLFERIEKCHPKKVFSGRELAYEAFRSLMEKWDYDADQYKRLVMSVEAYAAYCDGTHRPAEFTKTLVRFLVDETYKDYWPGTKAFLKWYPVADPSSVSIPVSVVKQPTKTQPAVGYDDDEEMPF